MTLHQLTHSIGFEGDIAVVRTVHRLLSTLIDLPRRWQESRREDAEFAKLDYRELSDLNWRQ